MNMGFARLLPAAAFGTFSIWFSLVNLLTPLFSFGANLHLLQKSGKATEQSYRLLAHAFVLLIVGWLLGMGIMATAWSFGVAIGVVAWALVIPIASLYAANSMFYSFFKGLGDFRIEARLQLMGGLFLAAFTLGLAAVGGISLVQIALLVVFCWQLLLFILGARHLHQRLPVTLHWRDYWPNRQTFLAQLGERSAFGLHEWLSHAYTHLSFLLLGMMVLPAQLATYRSAYLLVIPVGIIPAMVSQVLLQKLSRQARITAGERYRFRQFLQLSFFIGGAVVLFYQILGVPLADALLGAQYDPLVIAQLSQWLSVVFGLQLLSSLYGVLITACGYQAYRVKITLGAIAVQVSGTWIGAQAYGLQGALFAHLAAVAFILIGYATFSELKILKTKSPIC
ncbi:MAG: oligosaccharide flippase family protein [Salibacteraceae bacterium]